MKTLLNILDYQRLIEDRKFNEYPDYNTGTELISEFIIYQEADPELKCYFAKLILCRSFYGTYTAWLADVQWFIRGFFDEYQQDHIKPWLTVTIREAASQIMADEPFTKGILGTTFMFGVLEYYAKHHLGFRPLEYNFFDKAKKMYVKQYEPKKPDLTIKSAFEYLQKTNLPISVALNEIDTFTSKKLTDKGIPSENFTPHKVSERLNLPRNPMLHGETHSFYQAGPYLLMLYILFHLHDKS
ncbi:hypothetical protein ACFGVS_03180 [Mucilaginibacter sp. AW1-7]|uniref:hypothetical protein n=1 Tax=Mucilaginibacter sp. AW1-7 TaxID=3349874 RepID=UPI003F73E821